MLAPVRPVCAAIYSDTRRLGVGTPSSTGIACRVAGQYRHPVVAAVTAAIHAISRERATRRVALSMARRVPAARVRALERDAIVVILSTRWGYVWLRRIGTGTGVTVPEPARLDSDSRATNKAGRIVTSPTVTLRP